MPTSLLVQSTYAQGSVPLGLFEGDVFEMVDAATFFVMSHLNNYVGGRDSGPTAEAPSKFEIPERAVKEAIVNAVCHRDYTSCASVQVMLFKDRLEVWSPGPLPKGMTLAKFYRRHKSYPANPFLAYAMFLVKYIEETGTGSRDVVTLCEEAGLPRPKWYVEDGDDFRIVIKRPDPLAAQRAASNTPDKLPDKLPDNGLGGEGTVGLVLSFVGKHPGCNRLQIAKAIGLSVESVKLALAQLRATPSRVEHRGSKKTGGYYLKEGTAETSPQP